MAAMGYEDQDAQRKKKHNSDPHLAHHPAIPSAS
jgi:hypothetical protein